MADARACSGLSPLTLSRRDAPALSAARLLAGLGAGPAEARVLVVRLGSIEFGKPFEEVIACCYDARRPIPKGCDAWLQAIDQRVGGRSKCSVPAFNGLD